MKIYGGLYGWKCLLVDGKIIDLTNFDLDPIQRRGGTFLRSSRTNPFHLADGVKQVQDKIKKLGIDFIVAIGGDDTLGAARKFFEKYHFNIVGIPKTADNDFSSTYFTPGFPSAADAISEYTARIKRDAAYCVKRIFIIEVMGGKAGWIAAASSYGNADLILPPEKTVKLKKVLELTEKKYKKNQNFAVIVISKETQFDKPLMTYSLGKDQYGIERHELISYSLKREIEKNLGKETMVVIPGHHVSAGDPIEIDREYAFLLGEKAIELLKEGKFGYMSCIKRPDPLSNVLTVDSVPLSEVVGEGKYRNLNDLYFDFENFKVKENFFDYMEPILGKYSLPDQDYYDLILRISKQKGL